MNPFDLQNKTILITGASSGIGRATAILCSSMGAKLIITGRTESKLNDVFNYLEGIGHKKLLLDFEDEDSISKLVAYVEGVDGVVLSSGISENIPFSFTNEKKLARIMKVNFEAPFITTQKLVKEKKIKKGGSIVFVSSISGYLAVAKGISAYSASKGALCASIRVMALELSAKMIRVNTVCPGMVKSEMNYENQNLTGDQMIEDEARNYPLGYGSPEQVASSIVFLLGEGSSWITGTNLVIDGGASIH